uniref:Integrase catalytic domain-containing protein n=1 Tax=Cajanus cajan TaxID=3821 RepID=A0A151U8F7_CAJCA|nr:hypothetical protein KK1_019748 [Cajanus cajan]
MLGNKKVCKVIGINCIFENKNESFAKFKECKALIETQTNRMIKRFITDNGLEFCYEEFEQFCKKNRIDRLKAVRRIPRVRCLLIVAIKLKLANGEMWILQRVRHVPNLKKNLISL